MGKKQPVRVLGTRDDADRALQAIGELRRHIEAAEAEANDKIDAIRERLVEDTQLARDALADGEAALKVWAEMNKNLFVKPRSIEMNWGEVGFRRTPWKIVILGRLKVETVIERIRAAKMKSLIRTKEEIDREKAIAYLNSDLAKVGLKKVQRDEFFFEVKEIEVK